MLRFFQALLEKFDIIKHLDETLFTIARLEDVCQLLQRVEVQIRVNFARPGLVHCLAGLLLLLLGVPF